MSEKDYPNGVDGFTEPERVFCEVMTDLARHHNTENNGVEASQPQNPPERKRCHDWRRDSIWCVLPEFNRSSLTKQPHLYIISNITV